MSLIELLIAIAIVAILSAGAHMYYSDHVRDTKEVVAKTTLRKYGEALQLYSSDNMAGYTTSDPSRLLGSYTSELPEDPWGSVFVVDYFFGRVISPGPNGELETMAPYHPWHVLVATNPGGDDYIFDYERPGKLSFLQGDKVFFSNPDGSRLNTVIGGGARSVATAGNGSLMLYVGANGDVSFVEDTGEISTETKILDSSAVATYGITDLAFNSGTGTGGHEINWAPDMVRFSYICLVGGESALMIGSTQSSQEPYIVSTAPAGHTFVDSVFDDSGRSLLVTMEGSPEREECIYVAAVAERSSLTTFVDGLLPGAKKSQVAWSKNNKYIMYSDGTNSYLVGSNSRDLLKTYTNMSWPAFSPDGKKVALVLGATDIVGYHLSCYTDTDIPLVHLSGAAISCLEWD
jgi:prepilin-type N-terminal cleavage/methylation domain-containing protein